MRERKEGEQFLYKKKINYELEFLLERKLILQNQRDPDKPLSSLHTHMYCVIVSFL